MKKHTILLMSCLALSSCGMTDVWKDLESQGTLSENRLRPSEFEKVLLNNSGRWKLSYEGSTFYFTFGDDYMVVSAPDETYFLKNQVETDYHLDFDGASKVLLSLDGGGALQYLSENAEHTFVVTSFSADKIVASGETYGKEMILTPTTLAEINANEQRRKEMLVAYNKSQALNSLKTQLNNGVFRNSSYGFMAHYLISCDEENNWKLKVSSIVDGCVKHVECPITVDTTGDEDAILAFGKDVALNGAVLNKFYYNYLSGDLKTNDGSVTCDTRKASDIVAWYNSSNWRTHVVDQNDTHQDFKGVFPSQLEFDDRDPRNLVVCPWSSMGSYIGIKPMLSADNETGRIFIKWGEIYDMFGWHNNPDDYALVQREDKKFLSFCSSADGLYWSCDDNTQTIYVLSATGEQWFKMKR